MNVNNYKLTIKNTKPILHTFLIFDLKYCPWVGRIKIMFILNKIDEARVNYISLINNCSGYDN